MRRRAKSRPNQMRGANMKTVVLVAAMLCGAAAISPASAYAPYEMTYEERMGNLRAFSFSLLPEKALSAPEAPMALLNREVRLEVDTLYETCLEVVAEPSESGQESRSFCLAYTMQLL
jgi:hypothetical protein